MKPCSLATLSLPTCGVLRGSFQSPLPPASWSPQQSAHWPWRAPRRHTVSQFAWCNLSNVDAPTAPALSGSHWPFGEAARTAPGGEPGGAFCQNQQVAMANSSSEGRLVFPAVKTANRGGSQRCPCYPTYRHCYKWHQSTPVHFSLGLLARWQFYQSYQCSKQSVCYII